MGGLLPLSLIVNDLSQRNTSGYLKIALPKTNAAGNEVICEIIGTNRYISSTVITTDGINKPRVSKKYYGLGHAVDVKYTEDDSYFYIYCQPKSCYLASVRFIDFAGAKKPIYEKVDSIPSEAVSISPID